MQKMWSLRLSGRFMSSNVSFCAEDHAGQRCQVFTVSDLSIPTKVKVVTSDSRTLVFPRTKRKIVSLDELVKGELEIRQVIAELCQDVYYAMVKIDKEGKLEPLYLLSVDSFYKLIDNAY